MFNIPKLVPLEGSTTFAELSSQCGLDEDRLTRILRYSMIDSIFREDPAGHVQHTALSAHLARDTHFCDFLRTITMVFNPANAFLPIALGRYPQTQSIHEAAHGVARQSTKNFYDWLDENLELRENFDRGMEGISRGGQRMQDTDLRAYPWHNLPEKALIVDMGGSGGHFARDLAQMCPSFSIIVQDLPQVIQTVLAQLAEEVDTVSYQAHNFFHEQPVKGADVYFMRHIFHNHPDAECIRIITSLIPALKQGSRVLVSEYVVAPPGEQANDLSTKAMRQMDLMTMALFNAKERTRDEYRDLFQRASLGLHFQAVHQLAEEPGSCIFEAIFEG
jgi:2-polyprenyl-3-methyl-5-hydroxy-6-metoxy-1,4-benzoquinol methylase